MEVTYEHSANLNKVKSRSSSIEYANLVDTGYSSRSLHVDYKHHPCSDIDNPTLSSYLHTPQICHHLLGFHSYQHSICTCHIYRASSDMPAFHMALGSKCATRTLWRPGDILSLARRTESSAGHCFGGHAHATALGTSHASV
jgi:hypothetical protein